MTLWKTIGNKINYYRGHETEKRHTWITKGGNRYTDNEGRKTYTFFPYKAQRCSSDKSMRSCARDPIYSQINQLLHSFTADPKVVNLMTCDK